jgi:hypothetical protein
MKNVSKLQLKADLASILRLRHGVDDPDSVVIEF